MLTFSELIDCVASGPKPLLLAIDGLPVSGKTTLAERLVNEVGARCLWLDEFVKPEAEWASRDKPSFPFDYIRYDDFINAVRSLALERQCEYRPFDWQAGRNAEQPKVLTAAGIVVVEGVSALHPVLAPLYDLRVWVESDAETTFSAAVKRGVGAWAKEWEFMFLPSVELYLQTDPRDRADLIVSGRGIATPSQRGRSSNASR